MITTLFRWIYVVLFVGAVLFIQGCFGLSDRFQAPSIVAPTSSSWEISLTKLKVVDAQEDRSLMGVPLSDGDEPYLIMFGLQSRFGTSGSTQLQVNQYENDDWAGHLREGQQKNIPVSMGSMRFPDVTSAHVVAIVVVVIESDRTPWAIIRDRVEEVEGVLINAAVQNIENRSAVDLETTAFVDNLHLSLQGAVQSIAKPLTTGQAIENIIFSGVDTDEVIGTNSMVYMLNPPSERLGYPHYRPPYLTDVLTNRDLVFNRNALVFQNSSLGARYDVEVRVRVY